MRLEEALEQARTAAPGLVRGDRGHPAVDLSFECRTVRVQRDRQPRFAPTSIEVDGRDPIEQWTRQ